METLDDVDIPVKVGKHHALGRHPETLPEALEAHPG
jgi:hypothetical protein